MKYKPEHYLESVEVEQVDTITDSNGNVKMLVVEYMEGCAVVREGVFPEEVEDES